MKAEFFFKSVVTAGLCMTLGIGSSPLASAATRDIVNKTTLEQALGEVEGTVFPVGDYNERNKQHFTGDSFVARLAGCDGVNVANVTFVNGAHTYWHIHHGTCQIIMPVSGKGYYQLWGEAPKALMIGEVVTIPEGVKHWHGAVAGEQFQHVVITGPNKYTTEWLEPVNSEIFQNLK